MTKNKNKGIPIFEVIRKERGLSKAEMAQALNISRQLYRYLDEFATGCDYRTMVELRKVGKKSWKAFGELLESW